MISVSFRLLSEDKNSSRAVCIIILKFINVSNFVDFIFILKITLFSWLNIEFWDSFEIYSIFNSLMLTAKIIT